MEQTSRLPSSSHRPRPCAFVGAYRSSVTDPTALITGFLNYPQVSPASTAVSLDERPLLARTVPSDAGNVVPLVQYLTQVWNINHLVILNVNDAFGNAYVDAMRQAAVVYAPDLVIRQVPLDQEATPQAIATAVAAVKQTEYRYVLALVFGDATHDALMLEAHAQGIAGNGVHQWMFGDSFSGVDGRAFPRNSPLHLAYR